MRRETEKGYRPRIDVLEDRLTPTVMQPGPLLAPSAFLDVPQALARFENPGTQSQQGSGSLTMAVVTEAYPMPLPIDQPGVPAVRPFAMDPEQVFFAVITPGVQ